MELGVVFLEAFLHNTNQLFEVLCGHIESSIILPLTDHFEKILIGFRCFKKLCLDVVNLNLSILPSHHCGATSPDHGEAPRAGAAPAALSSTASPTLPGRFSLVPFVFPPEVVGITEHKSTKEIFDVRLFAFCIQVSPDNAIQESIKAIGELPSEVAVRVVNLIHFIENGLGKSLIDHPPLQHHIAIPHSLYIHQRCFLRHLIKDGP